MINTYLVFQVSLPTTVSKSAKYISPRWTALNDIFYLRKDFLYHSIIQFFYQIRNLFARAAPKLHPSAWERCRYPFLSARSGSNASFLCRAQDNRQSHTCLASSKPAVIKCESKEKAFLMRWARIRTNELQSVKLNFWTSYFLKSSNALLKIVSSM